MRWLPLLVLAGCATAGKGDQSPVDANGGGGVDGQQTTIDSSMPMIDAPPSGPQMRTLSQTTSPTVKALGSIACGNANGTSANSYYRVFDLPALGINTAFNVSQVSFGVENCDRISGAGGCTVAVRVGTYNGTPGASLATASMNILASNASVAIPEVMTPPGGSVNAPITATIPAGQKLLVAIEAPDGANTYHLYMGANDGGESAPGYIMATTCSVNAPTNISTVSVDYPTVHLLISVTGTYTP